MILVKNENHGFGKLAGLNPHKCLQSDVGEVWDQKELILTWLVHSQVQCSQLLHHGKFWCGPFIPPCFGLLCGGASQNAHTWVIHQLGLVSPVVGGGMVVAAVGSGRLTRWEKM